MLFNPIALRKAKIAYNFGLSEYAILAFLSAIVLKMDKIYRSMYCS